MSLFAADRNGVGRTAPTSRVEGGAGPALRVLPHARALGLAIVAALAPVAGSGPLVGPLAAQTIRGHLLEAGTDRPVDLGLIILLTESGDSITYVLTDERGYFSVTAPEPGSFHLLASALGFRETAAGIFELGPGGEMTVEFRIRPRPLPLDRILAAVERPVLEHYLVRNGFVRRYHRNVGGHFITPYDIDRAPAVTTEDLLAGVPGLTVRPPSRGELAFLGDLVQMRGPTGGRCTPYLFVDGIQVGYDPGDGGSLSSLVPLASVSAVEVYRGASEVPMEYNITRGGSELCGVLVFWTREGR